MMGKSYGRLAVNNRSRRLSAWRARLLLLAALAVAAVIVWRLGESGRLRTQARQPGLAADIPRDWESPTMPQLNMQLAQVEECPQPVVASPSAAPKPSPTVSQRPAPVRMYDHAPSSKELMCQKARVWGKLWWSAFKCDELSHLNRDDTGRVAGARLAHQNSNIGSFDVQCRTTAHGLAPGKYKPLVVEYVPDAPVEGDKPSWPVHPDPNVHMRALEGGGVVYERDINGSSVEEIINTACGMHNGRDNPDCPPGSTGCAVAEVADDLRYDRRSSYFVPVSPLWHIGVVYDKNSDDNYLLSTAPVTPDNRHETSVAIPAPIYTAATSAGATVPFWYRVHTWQLSARDKQVLRQAEPSGRLLQLAEAAVQWNEWHEKQHVRIYHQYRGTYMDVINNPFKYYKGERTVSDPLGFRLGVRLDLMQRWLSIIEDEGRQHGVFHILEKQRGAYASRRVPIDGFRHLRCERFIVDWVSRVWPK